MRRTSAIAGWIAGAVALLSVLAKIYLQQTLGDPDYIWESAFWTNSVIIAALVFLIVFFVVWLVLAVFCFVANRMRLGA